MDDCFCLCRLGSPGGLETKEIRYGETNPADEAHIEKFPSRDAAEMRGIIVPRDGLEFAH